MVHERTQMMQLSARLMAIAALCAACLAFLPGCQLLGGSSYGDVDINTTRKAIVVANAELRGANLLLQEVVRADVISQSDAREALSNLREARASLDKALTAVSIGGDPTQATDSLGVATAAIDVALAILAPAAESLPTEP